MRDRYDAIADELTCLHFAKFAEDAVGIEDDDDDVGSTAAEKVESRNKKLRMALLGAGALGAGALGAWALSSGGKQMGEKLENWFGSEETKWQKLTNPIGAGAATTGAALMLRNPIVGAITGESRPGDKGAYSPEYRAKDTPSQIGRLPHYMQVVGLPANRFTPQNIKSSLGSVAGAIAPTGKSTVPALIASYLSTAPSEASIAQYRELGRHLSQIGSSLKIDAPDDAGDASSNRTTAFIDRLQALKTNRATPLNAAMTGVYVQVGNRFVPIHAVLDKSPDEIAKLPTEVRYVNKEGAFVRSAFSPDLPSDVTDNLARQAVLADRPFAGKDNVFVSSDKINSLFFKQINAPHLAAAIERFDAAAKAAGAGSEANRYKAMSSLLRSELRTTLDTGRYLDVAAKPSQSKPSAVSTSAASSTVDEMRRRAAAYGGVLAATGDIRHGTGDGLRGVMRPVTRALGYGLAAGGTTAALQFLSDTGKQYALSK